MPFGFGHYCGTEAQLMYEENTQMRYTGSVGYVVWVEPPSNKGCVSLHGENYREHYVTALRPIDGQIRDAAGGIYIAQDGVAKYVPAGTNRIGDQK